MESFAMDVALKALANPRRRQILRLVWDQERPATELADIVGISRPAMSQHLAVRKESGLVTVRGEATRRLYRVDFARIQEVRALLDDFWGDKLMALKVRAEA